MISAPSPASRSSPETTAPSRNTSACGSPLVVVDRPNLDTVGVRVDAGRRRRRRRRSTAGIEHGVGELRRRYQLLGCRRGASRRRRGARWSPARSGRSGRAPANPAVSRRSAVDDVGQVPLPLCVVAVAGDGVGAEKQGGVDRHRRDAPAHLGEKQRQLDEAVAAAADVSRATRFRAGRRSPVRATAPAS